MVNLFDMWPFSRYIFPALQTLHNELHAAARQWYLSIPGVPRAQIVRHFGTFPETEQDPLNLPSGPTWHWWLCAVLPLDPRAQTTIIAMPTLAERLKALQRVLAFVQRRNSNGGGVAMVTQWLMRYAERVILHSRQSLYLWMGLLGVITLKGMEYVLDTILEVIEDNPDVTAAAGSLENATSIMQT